MSVIITEIIIQVNLKKSNNTDILEIIRGALIWIIKKKPKTVWLIVYLNMCKFEYFLERICVCLILIFLEFMTGNVANL